MRMTAASLALVCCVHAPIDTASAEDCSGIESKTDRLDCYDRAHGSAGKPQSAEGFDPISLTDLKTDIKTMEGKRIEVKGAAMSFAGGLLLTSRSGYDTAPIAVDIDSVPREQRRAFNDKCHSQCPVVIRGTIGETLNQAGIIAAAVELIRR